MHSYFLQCWRRSPFIRLSISLACGICLQKYCSPSPIIWYCAMGCGIAVTILFASLDLFRQFIYQFLHGILFTILFASVGALLVYSKDIRNNNNWLGKIYEPGDGLVAVIDEPLSERPKTFKAVAAVKKILHKEAAKNVEGKIIIYFAKQEGISNRLSIGTEIIFQKPLQPIKNSGNPGSFDFEQYSLYKGIAHQVFLQPGEVEVVAQTNPWLDIQINRLRNWVLGILHKHFQDTTSLGLAEALLIGYKDDLDKSLTQSYSNTGVVHVIAISGLHLGIIYMLLEILCNVFSRKKSISWLKPLLIIASLWIFSLLAGAQPSVLRSAVMFTCIALGKYWDRRSSIYNSLALSAFILLCHNPFWLWDIGFQLSYAAVLSIVVFMKPVYNLLYFSNKLIDLCWKLQAVTLAAQILTTPVSIFHFHQFPNYFFLANFIAVPVSSIILVGEIFLCILSPIEQLANLFAQILTWLIKLMNTCVQNVESLPFSVWNGLQITLLQVFMLYIAIAGFSSWTMGNSRKGFMTALFSLIGFFSFRSLSFIQASNQRRIIVYNSPQKTAIDILAGRQFVFIGDTAEIQNAAGFNNYVKPSRSFYRANKNANPNTVQYVDDLISVGQTRILVLEKKVRFRTHILPRPAIDLLIVGKDAQLFDISSLDIKLLVLTAPVSLSKSSRWKKLCDSLHIACHDISSNGAFVMNLR